MDPPPALHHERQAKQSGIGAHGHMVARRLVGKLVQFYYECGCRSALEDGSFRPEAMLRRGAFGRGLSGDPLFDRLAEVKLGRFIDAQPLQLVGGQ